MCKTGLFARTTEFGTCSRPSVGLHHVLLESAWGVSLSLSLSLSLPLSCFAWAPFRAVRANPSNIFWEGLGLYKRRVPVYCLEGVSVTGSLFVQQQQTNRVSWSPAHFLYGSPNFVLVGNSKHSNDGKTADSHCWVPHVVTTCVPHPAFDPA